MPLLLTILVFAILCLTWAKVSIWEKEKEVDLQLSRLSQRNAAWNEDALVSMAQGKFLLMQKAWSEHDLATLKQNLSPLLYQGWEELINQQKAANTRDVMANVSINKARIIDVDPGEGGECSFTICFDAHALDQTYVGNQLQSLASQKPEPFREFWTFRRDDVKDWALYEVTEAEDWRRFVNPHLA